MTGGKNQVDPLGVRFKEAEKEFRTTLPRKSLVGLRLDGKSFHTFTKQFARPYDQKFSDAMDATGVFVLEHLITGAVFGYVQSDEITLFFTDRQNSGGEMLFGGKVEKIVSTSASTASVGMMRALPDAKGLPVFDARLFVLPGGMDDLTEYLDWRRLDARKNAITMAAECVASSKQLLGVPTSERARLLEGTEYEKLPDGFLYGRLLVKERYQDTVTFTHGRTQEVITQEVTRSRWVTKPATRQATAEAVKSARGSLVMPHGYMTPREARLATEATV